MKLIHGNCKTPSCIAVWRRIVKKAGIVTNKYNLIGNGDKVLVGFSGGKDSFVLLEYLYHFWKSSPVNFYFKLIMINMDFPEEALLKLEKNFREFQIDFEIIPSRIPSIVTKKMKTHKNACVLCSRLRRGLIYSYARKYGFNKIALGHNADDVIETLLLNLFYNGKIKAMSPNFLNDDGDLWVIRPLYYVFEKEIMELGNSINFPILKIPCPLSKYRNDKRIQMKRLLNQLEKDFPAVRNNLIKSLEKIEYRYLPFKE